MADRTAISTIKGYFYQFDLSILKLLELENDSDLIVIEGVEDIDIKTATEEIAIQCKYYSSTEYNHSVIAKPIRFMLDHFKEVKNGTKERINYYLYGYYESGQEKLTEPIDIDFLKTKFLSYTEKGIQYKHHEKLNLDDSDLVDFISILKIDIKALEYKAQLEKIFDLLMHRFSCTKFEAETFYYNNALKIIKEISVKNNIIDRQLSKNDFCEKINTKLILFNQWFIEYKGRKKFFAELKNQYFTELNNSPFKRFFLIELNPNSYSRSEIKDIIFTISRKWSKLSRREPKPFCPYVYLHNIPKEELVSLKEELYSEGFINVDGFDFCGATFNPKSLAKPLIEQKEEKDQIKLKLINELTFIDLVLKEISSTKEIYQFYTTTPYFTQTYQNVKKIDIQIEGIKNIKEII
jgi:hypothetical protein